MTSQATMRQCFDAVTVNAAQARDPVEALRLCATRLKVFKRGRLLAESQPATAQLHLPHRPQSTQWRA